MIKSIGDRCSDKLPLLVSFLINKNDNKKHIRGQMHTFDLSIPKSSWDNKR